MPKVTISILSRPKFTSLSFEEPIGLMLEGKRKPKKDDQFHWLAILFYLRMVSLDVR